MKKNNRNASLKPRGHQYWCGKCDRCLVNSGIKNGKCMNCGNREGKRRAKVSSVRHRWGVNITGD